jgi:hypothetical protein
MNKLEHYPCMIDFFDLVCYLHEAKEGYYQSKVVGITCDDVDMCFMLAKFLEMWRFYDKKKFEILQAICFQQVFSIHSVCC